MSHFGAGRDGFSRDVSGRPAAHRTRSRSPPQGRIRRDELPPPHPRVDRDGPPKILARKPSDSSASAYAPVSTSVSSSTYDRTSSSDRHPLPDRPDASSSHRASASAESLRDQLFLRLSASRSERTLFEQIEDKRFSILEDRKELGEQIKKIKTLQDYRNKAGANDSKVVAKLTEHQQAHSRLDQKIRSDTDELYRMQLRWQLDLFPLMLEEHIKAYREDEHKRHDRLKDDIAAIEAHNRAETKHLLELENKMRNASGTAQKCQSDNEKVKKELSTLAKDVSHLHQELSDARNRLSDSRSVTKGLRDDLNKDVVQITEHARRIQRIEDKVDALQAKLAVGVGVQQTATSNPALPIPAAASSSAANTPRPLPVSPVQDPRPRPAVRAATPAAASTSVAASANAATDESATKKAEAAPLSEAGSEAVTRAQLRKWDRDLKQDLELRFDEIKDLAVAEATAENQACMEDRLRKLARRWKEKAERGEIGRTDPAEGSSTSAAAGFAGGSSSDRTAIPMDTDPIETQLRPSDHTTEKDTTLQAPTTEALTNSARPSSPTQSHADSNGVGAIPPLGTEAQAASSRASGAAGSTIPDAVRAANVELTSATEPLSIDMSAAVASSTASAQLQTVSTEEGDRDGTGKITIPAEILKAIRIVLKEHGVQIATIKQELEDLRSSEAKKLDNLLTSPTVVKRLLATLKQNGLDVSAELLSAVKPLLQSTLTALRDELAPALASQPSLVERVQTLEDARSELKKCVTDKANWLQKQIEALDDQCSLQGALLVKLAEHANPRRPPPRPSPSTSAAGDAQDAEHARTSLPRSALPQQPTQHAQPSVLEITPQPVSQLQHHQAPYHGGQHQPQQPSHLRNHVVVHPSAAPNVAATGLSPHAQHPVHGIPDQLRQAQAQPQQLLHQQLQQAQQQASYGVPGPQYPYQDAHQRRGYP